MAKAMNVAMDFVTAFTGSLAAEAAKSGGEKVGKETADRLIKGLEEKRKELFAFIGGLEPGVSHVLMRRHRLRADRGRRIYGYHTPYQDGDEALFVKLLNRLYIGLSEPHEINARISTFEWLANMKDEEFDASLMFLHDDRVIQWIKRFWSISRYTVVEGARIFATEWPRIVRVVNHGAVDAAIGVNRFRRYLNSKGVR